MRLAPADILPADPKALLFGRVWSPKAGGPIIVRVDKDRLTDVTPLFPTARDLCEAQEPATALRAASGEDVGALSDVLANTAPETREPSRPWLLSPIDLQAVKAAGVTFVTSMLERVIEEKARGDLSAAAGFRGHCRREPKAEAISEVAMRLRPLTGVLVKM